MTENTIDFKYIHVIIKSLIERLYNFFIGLSSFKNILNILYNELYNPEEPELPDVPSLPENIIVINNFVLLDGDHKIYAGDSG